MDSHDAAYIAGFLDGEGYISIRRSNRTKCQNPAYRLVIGFTNTNRAILDWIKKIAGGGCINPKSRRKAQHSEAWELTIHTKDIQIMILAETYPYIRIKQRQAELAISFLALGKVRKTMTEVRGKTWPIFRAVPEDIAERERFKQELTEMNKRGPICPLR